MRGKVTDPAPFPEPQPFPTAGLRSFLCYPCLPGPLSHARTPTPLPASSLLSLLSLRTPTPCTPSPIPRDIQHAPMSQVGQLLGPEGGPRVCTVVQGELRCPGHPFSSSKAPSGAAPATAPEPGHLPSSPCLTPEALSSLSGHHPISLVRASCAKGTFKFIFSSMVGLETTCSTSDSPEWAQGKGWRWGRQCSEALRGTLGGRW